MKQQLMGMTAIIPTKLRKLVTSREDVGYGCLPFFFSFKDKNDPIDFIYNLESSIQNLGRKFIESLQITIKG